MEEITDGTLRQLLTVISEWYDQLGYINMLKVLYRDLLKNNYELNKATKVMELMNLLIASGDLDSTDLSLLYDTIKISEQYGLEKKIKCSLLPSFPNVRDVIISKFTCHRQKVMKLGMILIDEEVEKISGLYNKMVKEYADTWTLIMDLERNRIICEGKMDAFIEKLNSLELPLAVEVLTEDIPTPKPSSNPEQANDIPEPQSNSGYPSEIPNTSSNSGYRFGESNTDIPKLSSNSGHPSDIPNAFSNSGDRGGEDIQLTLTQRKRKKRESDDEDGSYEMDPLYLVNQLTKNKDNMKIKDIEEISVKVEELHKYFKNMSIRLKGTENGSIVFHLYIYDPNALMNLWEINFSGELIKDLAQILVQEKHQEEFLDEWMTCIDENEYKAALTKLQENGQCSSMFSIVSDDVDWEKELIKDLNRKRPELKFTIMKKWRVTKPITIDHLIGESRKVIIAFSSKPLTDYSKYAAHSVVIGMLEARTLDDTKIIPVKISEDAIVPSEFHLFTSLNFWEEKFIDKLLENCGADTKSIVFNLSVSDANALENLRDIHLSGDLIQDLAEVLVPADQQEEFVDRWSSGLDEKQYQAALSRLKAKGGPYHLCIVSDDIEWENKLMEDLQLKRPELKCTILKKWKSETVNNVIRESRKIIIAFPPKPLTEYSKYAAHSAVIEMLKAETLDDAKIITVKISEDAVVPIEFELFNMVNAFEQNFADKVLQHLDEFEIVTPDEPSLTGLEGTSEQLSSDEHKTQIEAASEKVQKGDVPSTVTLEGTSEELSSGEKKAQLMRSSGIFRQRQHIPYQGPAKIKVFRRRQQIPDQGPAKIKEEGRISRESFSETSKLMPEYPEYLDDELFVFRRRQQIPDQGLAKIKEEGRLSRESFSETSKLMPEYPEYLDDELFETPFHADLHLQHLRFLDIGDLRGYVEEMLRRKSCYVKDEGLLEEKEYKKEYSTQPHSVIPIFSKSSQDMDDSQTSISQELISEGILKYENHIEDICNSLRIFCHHMIFHKEISDKQIIQFMSRRSLRYRIRLRRPWYYSTKFEDTGKIFAHVLIAVLDEQAVLEEIHDLCTDYIVSNLSAECKKLKFKYNIISYRNYDKAVTVSFLIHLLCNAPRLRDLRLVNCTITGVTEKNIVNTLYERGVVLELTDLDISHINLSAIKGSSPPTSLAIAPKLKYLCMRDCSLSGAIIDDMVKECSSRGTVLELKCLNIHENNLNDIKGSSLATLLAVAPKLNDLDISNCSLSGAIIDDMVKECSSRGVVLEIKWLYMRKNVFKDIKGSSLATLLAVAPKLNYLYMSNCSLSGAIIDDMVKECSSRGVVLELTNLDIRENNLNDIKVSSLATLLTVAPKLIYLCMSNCSLSGAIIDDMVKECSSRGVVLELTSLDIKENNLNDIKVALLATLHGVAPKLKYLDMKNCNLSCVDDMVKECHSRGFKLYI